MVTVINPNTRPWITWLETPNTKFAKKKKKLTYTFEPAIKLAKVNSSGVVANCGECGVGEWHAVTPVNCRNISTLLTLFTRPTGLLRGRGYQTSGSARATCLLCARQMSAYEYMENEFSFSVGLRLPHPYPSCSGKNGHLRICARHRIMLF